MVTGQFYGADVAQLRALARQVEKAADELDLARRVLTAKISATTAWQGPEAARFRSEWTASHAAMLRAATLRLRDTAGTVHREADDQERTSAADGASSAAGAVAAATGAGVAGWFGSGAAPVAPPSGASARDTTAWWSSLSGAEQARLLRTEPGTLGMTDGIPAAIRDQANRDRLVSERARLTAELAALGPGHDARSGVLSRSLAAIDKVEASLASLATAGTPGQLLLLDTSGDPVKAAIAVGDVDTAANVAVFTPGIDSRPDLNMDSYVASMVDLRREALTVMASHGEHGGVATVAWLGYEAPDGLTSGLVNTAREASDRSFGVAGAPALASFGEGIRSTNPDVRLTALGHSYGSFTTGLALQQTDAFDAMAVFGSPGLGTSNADAFHVPADERFVLEARGDAVADLGAFGRDPNRMAGLTDLATGADGAHLGSVGHSQYLMDSSTSQFNLAAVVTGNTDAVITGNQVGVGDVLRTTFGTTYDVTTQAAVGAVNGSETGAQLGGQVLGAPGEAVGRVLGAAGGAVVDGTGAVVDAAVNLATGTGDVVADVWDKASTWWSR